MKRILSSFALVAILSTSVFAQNGVTASGNTNKKVTATDPNTTAQENPNAGDFKFSDETWDFGNIPQNKPVTHDFTFTNTGKEPIVISNAQASCGCTVPKWPKEPILPGKTADIQVTYNAANAGGFNKSVTITSNAKTPTKMIYIKGNVEAPPVEQTTPDKQPNMLNTPNK